MPDSPCHVLFPGPVSTAVESGRGDRVQGCHQLRVLFSGRAMGTESRSFGMRQVATSCNVTHHPISYSQVCMELRVGCSWLAQLDLAPGLGLGPSLSTCLFFSWTESFLRHVLMAHHHTPGPNQAVQAC